MVTSSSCSDEIRGRLHSRQHLAPQRIRQQADNPEIVSAVRADVHGELAGIVPRDGLHNSWSGEPLPELAKQQRRVGALTPSPGGIGRSAHLVADSPRSRTWRRGSICDGWGVWSGANEEEQGHW